MTSSEGQFRGPRPAIFVGWTNRKARQFCESFLVCFAELFPGLDLLSSNEEFGLDRDLRFAVLVLPEGSRGGEWLQYQAGLLEQRLGIHRVVRLMLAPTQRRRVAGPLAHFESFDLKPKSILRLCKRMGAAAGQPWGKHESRAFRAAYREMVVEFRPLCVPGSRAEKPGRRSEFHLSREPIIRALEESFDGRGVGAVLHALGHRDPGIGYLLERGAIATMQQPATPGGAGRVYLPVSVYVSGGALEPPQITSLVEAIFDAFDLELVAELPPIAGSSWQQWFARTRSSVSLEGAVELLERIAAIGRAAVEERRREVESSDSELLNQTRRQATRDRVHRALSIELATAAHDPELARLIARRAGFVWLNLPVFRTAMDFWDQVVDAALSGRVRLRDLIEAALAEFPFNSRLTEFRQVFEESSDPSEEEPDRVQSVQALRDWIRYSRMQPFKDLVATKLPDERRVVRFASFGAASTAGRPPVAGTLSDDQMIGVAENPQINRIPEGMAELLSSSEFQAANQPDLSLASGDRNSDESDEEPSQ